MTKLTLKSLALSAAFMLAAGAATAQVSMIMSNDNNDKRLKGQTFNFRRSC